MEVEKDKDSNLNLSSFAQNQKEHSGQGNRVAPERKLSKRREAQEEKHLVIQLFKELMSKVNDAYIRSNNAPAKEATKVSKNVRMRPKGRGVREAIVKQVREPRIRKQSSEQSRLRLQKKQEVLNNYSVVMSYQIVNEGIQEQQRADIQ